MKTFTATLLFGLASIALARTDLAGCTSSQTTNQWHEASMIWWVPESGEICEFVDCGGGRAPPKTTQPGCPLYSGTATLTPNYMPGWGPNGKIAASTTTVAETTSSSTSSSKTKTTGDSTESATTTTDSMVTPAPTSSPAVSMTTVTSPTSKSGNATSSAATSTKTGNAAGASSANMGGIMVIAAAVMGGMAL
ncbi:hypothetical protein N7509_006763 [Penicillium cosmopolitanum]|uniref:Siderophore biosynthesis enzyme n=1 Tax=Penicillium cosmopolitanum TaxID=1131564 RepID=A0A9W9VXJ1_9EURO|nr:uncharacterized protein N7509_006763 [Penicillium cosmopolitanum]KAJ5391273.1 hypothetical protein N7509_006763 [Penicillium cosmopolitanum]